MELLLTLAAYYFAFWAYCRHHAAVARRRTAVTRTANPKPLAKI